MSKKPTKKLRPVVVTTSGGGVHFGYTDEDGRGDTIKLKDARNAYYWKVPVGTGVANLAGVGPQVGSRIGVKADVVLREVFRVYECSSEAVKSWEDVLWTK